MNILNSIPAGLHSFIQQRTIEEVREGMSGTLVFRLEHRELPDQYLKIAERGSEQDLQPELSRLLWLRGHLAVPEVRYWGEDATRQYLLISAVPGLALYDAALRDHLPRLMQLYAAGLRQIHSLPIEGCPFDMRLDVRIAQAGRQYRAGLVDVDNLDPERRGRSAQSLFRELLATRPTADEDLVFTHGDYCTPNVLVDPDRLALNGWIDWGRAGVADRYNDLALAARSIDYNFGAAWITPFFAAYGLTAADTAKVAFYQLLDEFF